MKNFLKPIVVSIVTFLAQATLWKYKPRIILISGSVGKTSTKDAIAAVLSSSFYIRASEKSYNSDTGVPLTILGCKNPWNNYWGWMKVIAEGVWLVVGKNHYPKTLVLEIGADKPGDITRMLKWIHPDVVVVTKLPEIPVHVEAYASPFETREEEFSPAHALSSSGLLIYNRDDDYAHELAKEVSVPSVTYGMHHTSTMQITDGEMIVENDIPKGIQAKLSYKGSVIPFSLMGVFGLHHTYPAVSAVLVAVHEGMTLFDAVTALATYEPPRGRGRVLLGREESVLIDDTYNSSPVAIHASLDTLSSMKTKRRVVAILGDMLELGTYTLREHEEVGRRVAKTADILCAVGIRARGIAEGALSAGMKAQKVFTYKDAHALINASSEFFTPKDIILIKGSQSMRMERVVESFLREHIDPREVLVRQDKEWLRKA